MTVTLPIPADRRQLATFDQLAAIPEEEIWLAKHTLTTPAFGTILGF